MRTLQAILSGAIICGIMVVSGCGNDNNAPAGGAGAAGGGAAPPGQKISVYLLPKVKGIGYFETCAKGAQEAAKELGNIELTYDGPVSGNADENCNPAHSNALANNTLTGSLPDPPSAGIFFAAQFTQLVQNAYRKVP